MKIIKQEPNNKTYPTYMPLRSIFDDFFTPSIWEAPFISQSLTSADVWEEKDDVYVKMALPGVNKEDIKISIMEDSINISGQTKKEEETEKNKEKKYYYRSTESSFEQSFNLPTKIQSDKAEAEFKDGVLTVKLPKADAVKPKEIEIK